MKACLDVCPIFKVGDPMPDGYIARQAWAEVHLKAGLKQEMCASCMRCCFPHELSPAIHSTKAVSETRVGRRKHYENVTLTHRYCLECESHHRPTKG